MNIEMESKYIAPAPWNKATLLLAKVAAMASATGRSMLTWRKRR